MHGLQNELVRVDGACYKMSSGLDGIWELEVVIIWPLCASSFSGTLQELLKLKRKICWSSMASCASLQLFAMRQLFIMLLESIKRHCSTLTLSSFLANVRTK